MAENLASFRPHENTAKNRSVIANSRAEKSLTSSQYEEIFNAVITANLSQSLPGDVSPKKAKSPRECSEEPKESASLHNSQQTQQQNIEFPEKSKPSRKKKSKSKGDITFQEALSILKESHTESSLNESFNIDLYENQLSQPPKNLSHRERLEWLQERRVVGLWVRCDMPNCDKWRWLENVHDPTELPDKWFCYMNPGKFIIMLSTIILTFLLVIQ